MECALHTAEKSRTGEHRTFAVILITASMMTAEIAGGAIFGSMSLLADGVHMGTHAAALIIALIAFRAARIHRTNRNFTFGTGKVGVLAGFTSALILLAAAFGMLWESAERILSPVQIHFNEALLIAAAGLIVNIISALLLNHDHDHSRNDHDHAHNHKHTDHNLRAAYLHVIADAVTSAAAIAALLAGKFFNALWLDPAVAVLGSVMIFRWAAGLIKDTAAILLDYLPAEPIRSEIEQIVHEFNQTVADLHLWKIDASQLGLILTVNGSAESCKELREKILKAFPIVHCTIEYRA